MDIFERLYKELLIKKSLNREIIKAMAGGSRLDYFKRKLLEVLENQEEKENRLEKSANEIFEYFDDVVCKGKLGNIGEIRTWKNGAKYKKMPNKKWVRVYDTHDRHTEISIARLKGKVKRAQSIDELFDIVMNNTHRFSDENGKPLDIVMELKKEVEAKKKTLNAGKETEQQQVERISSDCKKALKAMENPEKLEFVDYTRENYNKLFPRGEAETPIGKVKLGAHQFERLAGKDGGARSNFLAAMYQTLTNPICVIDDMDNQGRKAKLFIGYFKDEKGDKGFFSITPDFDGENVQVSFGVRKQSKILHKIKRASSFLYVKEGGRQTTEPVYKPLPVSQIIPQGDKNSSDEIRKKIRESPEYMRAKKLMREKDVKPLEKTLSENEIIKRLSGGDMTGGSCISLTLAYAANRAGYDVIDYRGGASREYFCRPYSNLFQYIDHTLPKYTHLYPEYKLRSKQYAFGKDMVVKMYFDKNDNSAYLDMVSDMKPGKEYIMILGSHAAVMKKKIDNLGNETIFYLEMQSRHDEQNTWHEIDDYKKILPARFRTRKRPGKQRLAFLADVEALGNNATFLEFMRFVNNEPENQKKGSKGRIK